MKSGGGSLKETESLIFIQQVAHMKLWEDVEHIQGKMRNTWERNPFTVIK